MSVPEYMLDDALDEIQRLEDRVMDAEVTIDDLCWRIELLLENDLTNEDIKEIVDFVKMTRDQYGL